MKRPFLIIISFLFAFSAVAQKEHKPRFFYTNQVTKMKNYNSGADTWSATAFVMKFGTLMTTALGEEFPCSEPMGSREGVEAALRFEYRDQILGKHDNDTLGNQNIKDIGKQMDCDYLLVLRVTISNTSLALTVSCLDNRKAKLISRATEYESVRSKQGDQSLFDKGLSNMVKHVIDDLKKCEVCPYKGPVTVQVLSEKTTNESDEHQVYCSKMDRTYRKTIKTEKKSSADWKLEKNSKVGAGGDLKFSLAEKEEMDETDPCYPCEPMVTGNRISNETKFSFAEINGIAEKSVSEGQKVATARIEIKFLDDGTYLLHVKASSQTGNRTTTVVKKINCDCCKDNESQNTTTSRVVDVGLKEVFGPFKGTADQKVLSEKQTIKRVNPETKENETISFEFNLIRE
jgi:hypothetical protein